MCTIRVRGPCGSRAREGAGELKGKTKLKSVHRRIPVGEAQPLPEGGGEKEGDLLFPLPGAEEFGKSLQSAPGAVSIPSCSSPPSCCMVGLPSAGDCSQVLLAGPA